MSLPQKAVYKKLSAYFLFLNCVFLLITSCNTPFTSDKIHKDSLTLINLPAPGTVSAAETEYIKNSCQIWYDSVLKHRGFNGGIIVAKAGHIIFEAYSGTGHMPGTDTINQNMPLHIASVSKTFTAMAVLKLWQDGKLNIDDPFCKYFPAFNYPTISIRHLLSHRSGLPNYNYFMEALGWDKKQYASNADVMNYLISRKAELTDITAPNTHFTYCNTNYALLALLIEKISGLSYASYMNQTFFGPLQMKNSYVFTLADTVKAIPSYNWRGHIEALNFLDGVYGDKNIYTTPRDLLTWDRALSCNLIFTDETLKQAYAPYSHEKPGIRNYGLGWRMNLFSDGKKIIYHNGWWHGSNSAFIRLIPEKATIIVIGNKFTRSIYNAKILSAVFGNYYSPVDEEESISPKDSILDFASPAQKETTSSLKLKPAKKEPFKKKGHKK